MSTKENKDFIATLAEQYNFDKNIKWKRLSKNKHDSGGSIRVFGNNENEIKISILEDINGHLSLAHFQSAVDFSLLSKNLGNSHELLVHFFANTLIGDIEECIENEDVKDIEEYAETLIKDINEDIHEKFMNINYDSKTSKYLPTSNQPPQFTKDEIIQLFNNKDISIFKNKFDNIVEYPENIELLVLSYGFFYSTPGKQIRPENIGVNFDFENTGIQVVEENGISYLECYACGDWETPVTSFYFLNKNTQQLESFFPLGNKYCYNVKTKEAYGNTEDEYEEKMVEFLNEHSDKAEASIKADFFAFLNKKFQ